METATTKEQWLAARLELLEKERAHTSARDELTKARMAMPWLKIETDYRFFGEHGECQLRDLFKGKTQLILQHFMFGEDWQEGCRGCSLMADSVDPVLEHIAQRDVSFVAVSVAPVETLLSFRERMGWHFDWVSSAGSSFNRDFGVTLGADEFAGDDYSYNYGRTKAPHSGEMPGVSVFNLGDDGAVYHSYSCYARGLETTMGIYNLLDLVPKGRDEGSFAYGTEWLRLKDAYK